MKQLRPVHWAVLFVSLCFDAAYALSRNANEPRVLETISQKHQVPISSRFEVLKNVPLEIDYINGSVVNLFASGSNYDSSAVDERDSKLDLLEMD